MFGRIFILVPLLFFSGVQFLQSAQSQGYVLKPNDKVKVSVFQEEDMDTEVRISKSGFIVMPLLGSVRLAGKTVDQAIEEITKKLDADYIVNPQVSLSIVEYAKERITVLGQVKQPGTIEIPDEGTLDILGAIAMAGGYSEIADPGKIILRRMVGGEVKVYRIDGKRLARDSTAKPFKVLPEDIIEVGESIF